MNPYHFQARSKPQHQQDPQHRAEANASAIAIHRLLWVLTLLATLVILYLASSLILPIIVAALLALFSSPLVGALRKIHIPQMLASGVVILGLSLIITLVLSLVINPATEWMDRLPTIGSSLTAHISDVSDSIDSIKESVMPENNQKDDTSVQSAINESVVSIFSLLAQSTIFVGIQILMVAVITFFFLVYGHDLFKSIIRLFPSQAEKRSLFEMFEQLRDELSQYVLTISVINVGLGIATFAVLSLLGVEDPLLWGAMAGILNFAPYIGPIVMAGVLFLVGFSETQYISQALVIPACFLALNLIESQGVTPMALGKRFNMNPLVVVIWMLLWGWIWGVIGVLIAIPLLVIVRIATQRLGFLDPLVQLLGGTPVTPTESVENFSTPQRHDHPKST